MEVEEKRRKENLMTEKRGQGEREEERLCWKRETIREKNGRRIGSIE